ncbi:histone-like nucleoid-structuring protein, MvaT/MvaU family [Pseudomonas putida]|uniref:histone-like nucleoid-structuring protein, MvaT/MvaU family n=1 Tax=Pseudomonas putida TaxID=303 RepID=UPI00275AA272|nr:histone-like nucleoid-structuring protein, MvaT/MvaU family [Pseudomonas putida]MDP9520516.1 histone-like nucleoid-structuring protein, MvaT/MvaU family [Pseudomonas putida]
MSRLAEFRALERLLAAKKSELSFIKIDPRLIREFEFESKLHMLLAEYQFNLSHVLAIMESECTTNVDKVYQQCRPVAQPRRYRARQSKYYINPHTGQEVEAKSTLHKTVRSWIEEYGRAEVESWATAWSLYPHKAGL